MTSNIKNSYLKVDCLHWTLLVIYEKNLEGGYTKKRICEQCKQEVKDY